MQFAFTAEEEDLRKALGDFVQREVVEKEIDRLDHIPEETVGKLGELGYFSLMMPAEHGGESASWVDLGIVAEELAKGSAVLALLMTLSYEVNLLLSRHGQPAIQREYLPSRVTGGASGCIAITEEEAGSDVGAIRMTARRDGGDYVLNGEKSPVSFGARADYTIAFAKTDAGDGSGTVTAFIVPFGTPGLTRSAIPTMGLSSSGIAALVFDNVRIPAINRVGEEGRGLDINREVGLFSDGGRLLCALIGLGVSRRAMKKAAAHARERTAFGRPIVQFEAISGKIAEDATMLEAATWLCYRGLALKDRDQSCEKEAAMAAWWCPRLAFRIVENTILIHGHPGYTDDHPFERMLRDVVGLEIIAGTEEILKLTIARQVAGSIAVPEELACRAMP